MLAQLGKGLLSLTRHEIGQYCFSRGRHGIRRTVIGSFDSEEEYLKSLEKRKGRKAKKNVNEKPEKEEENTEIDEEFNLYSDIPQEILKLKYRKPNPANVGSFSNMMLNMKSRMFRERHGTCLLEGKFLIADAMKSGMFIRTLYFSRLENLVGLPVDILRKMNLVKVTFEEIKQASEVQVQTEGLLAIATKQDDTTRKKVIETRRELFHENGDLVLPVTLVCDNVRDAGNMGTLLRSAAAAGCEQVLVTKGCVDIWEPKVVRAGAGAHFKIPIEPNLSWNDVTIRMQKYDIKKVFLSHHSMEDLRLSQVLPDLQDDTDETEFYQKITSQAGFESDVDVTKEDFSKVIFKSKSYYDVTFSDKGHNVIVIGGEVHGVSPNACLYSVETLNSDRSLKRQFGELVNIPMTVGSECLNTAVAGSVILFEARRQIVNGL